MTASSRKYDPNCPVAPVQPTADKTLSAFEKALTVALLCLLAILMTLGLTLKPPKTPPTNTPGSIAGLWEVRCHKSKGMTIEFKLTDETTAVGRIVKLGHGYRLHYREGDEIFRLVAGAKGTWEGKFLWRNNRGEKRWDGIVVTGRKGSLHATGARDPCFAYMKRTNQRRK